MKKADTLTRAFRRDAEETIADVGTGELDPDRYMLDIGYTVISTGSIVSVSMDVYQFTGGAHGSATIFTWNYERKTGKIVPVTRFLPQKNLAKVAKKVRTELIRYYASQGYDLDTEWLYSGTNPRLIRNYNTYTVTLAKDGKPESLTIYFADYQIGPHAIGMPTVVVNLNSLDVSSEAL